MKINGLLSDPFSLDGSFAGLSALDISVCCCNQVITHFNDNEYRQKGVQTEDLVKFVDDKHFLTNIFG